MNAPETTVTQRDIAEAMRRTQQKAHEQAFETTIKDYILNHGNKYQFGGVLNLMTTVRSVLEKLSGEEVADYNGIDARFMAFAAKEVGKVELEVDVRYGWKP